MGALHRLSKIFQPITAITKHSNITHKDVTSKSQRLMLELGIIHQATPGCFHFLPLGLKSLNKLIAIVDQEMSSIGGQKIIFPTLVKSELWKTSGRSLCMGQELMTLEDRHNHEYILCPTHEETASNLIASLAPISYKNFPLLLYQITSKFRDEMKPRFGLIRGREFLMKDMYSFDLDKKAAMETYETICQSYDTIFKRIGIDFVKVLGASGAMGGNLSHEYHYQTDIGEDKIFSCQNCNYKANMELVKTDKECPECGDKQRISSNYSIEVGHTFLLGDKYSKPLKAHYLSQQSKPEVLQMGSYGLGLSRILAASVEVLSSEKEMRWPDSLAPFNVVIIPPKKGSKEEQCIENLGEKLYQNLETQIPKIKDSILLDDRISLTIGRRFVDARRVGYRFIVVLNSKAQESVPVFEVNDLRTNSQVYLGEEGLVEYIKDKIQKYNLVFFYYPIETDKFWRNKIILTKFIYLKQFIFFPLLFSLQPTFSVQQKCLNSLLRIF